MEFIFLYLAIVNVVGLLIMLMDKQKAIRNKYRIPEKTIWILALLGGSTGCTLGMCLFRHKTQKGLFPVLLPVLGLLQVLIAYWLYTIK